MSALLGEGEKLKQEGNEAFAAGRVEESISKYRQAQQVLLGSSSEKEKDEATQRLLAILFSNEAQAHFSQNNYEASLTAAENAVSCDKGAWKAWYRLARAQWKTGSVLKAYLTIHRPLRGMTKGNRELAQLLSELEGQVYLDLGLRSVTPSFDIAALPGGDGESVGAVANAKIAAEKVLFIESGLAYGKCAPGEDCCTTESLVKHFAGELYENREDETFWNDTRRRMAGSWPRSVKEIPSELMDKFESEFECFTDIEPTKKQELLQLALQCRYNRFHSGFFRICALLNHSCTPNAAMKYVRDRDEVHLLVVSDVQPGEPLTVKYLEDNDYFLGVYQRRNILHNSWLFWCDCPRCKTELDVSCTSEYVRCSKEGCPGFVHLPGPPFADPKLSKVDPKIVTERKCEQCGTLRTWSDEEVARFGEAKTVVQRTLPMHGGMVHLGSLIQGLQRAHSIIRPAVHEDHWMYRVLNYLFCVTVLHQVDYSFGTLANDPEGFKALMGEPLAIEGEEPQGGLTLFWMTDLWRRICSFYPNSQGWALHVAACRLAVGGLIISYTSVPALTYSGTPFRPLSPEAAKIIFKKHASCVTPEVRKGFFKVLQMRCGNSLPQKDAKDLRKLLS